MFRNKYLFCLLSVFAVIACKQKTAEVADKEKKDRIVEKKQIFKKLEANSTGVNFENNITENLETLENLFNFDYFYNGAGVGVERGAGINGVGWRCRAGGARQHALLRRRRWPGGGSRIAQWCRRDRGHRLRESQPRCVRAFRTDGTRSSGRGRHRQCPGGSELPASGPGQSHRYAPAPGCAQAGCGSGDRPGWLPGGLRPAALRLPLPDGGHR